MIAGLDSATPPSSAQVQAARAAGIVVWSGYLATRPELGVGPVGSRFGLFRPWRQVEFGPVKTLPGLPIAYASGWDDPASCKALALAWGVRLCLDVEAGIRPDGPWIQNWLDAGSAGLYGNGIVHPGRRAAFHILSAYPQGGDPGGESWPSWLPAPAAPCGWQWAGSHSAFGITVDSSWLDPWFGGNTMFDQNDRATLIKQWVGAAAAGLGVVLTDTEVDTYRLLVHDNLDNQQSVLAKIVSDHPKAPGAGGPTTGTIQGTIKLGG